MRALICAAFACAAPALSAGDAEAATCSFVTIGSVSFGPYDVFDSASVDSTGTVTYHCSSIASGESVTISLSTGGSGSYAPRELSSGTQALDYNLYLDAARQAVWGDGSGGTSIYGPVEPEEGTDVEVSAYGRIPARQDVSAGSYSDSVTVTLNF